VISCPYPGLRPFRREESIVFFGRDEQVDQLLAKLERSHFLAVVGASGCGKSSLVRAGLIPALMTGLMVSGGARWVVSTMRPGDQPMRNLARALIDEGVVGGSAAAVEQMPEFLMAALRRGPLGLAEILRDAPPPGRKRLLLLIDQFEEIFRFRREGGADESDAFVELLLASARYGGIPIYVVLTMRSDYLGDCNLFAGLPEALNDSQFLTPRLTRDQRREAIEAPALVFDGKVEPELVNRLLNDMDVGPDQLPLMQHALMRLWSRACSAVAPRTDEAPGPPGVVLTLADYEEMGGLKLALSGHADEVFDGLDERQQTIAEALFRSLTERGADGRDIRRPTPLRSVAEVAGVPVERVVPVVEAFRHPRLSVLAPLPPTPLEPETILDISHESLIRQWQRLRAWAEAESSSAEMYRRLEGTASLFRMNRAGLWDSPDLDFALEWKARERPNAAWACRYGGDFDGAMLFLSESQNAKKRKLAIEKERRAAELETAGRLAVRDLLDAFFQISTSRIDPTNIDKTFDSVLRFCSQLGYELAMISLVDHQERVIRGARASGNMTDMVGLTVRPLLGSDILAIAVREHRVIVVPDSTTDPTCDQAAISLAQIRGQVVLPLVNAEGEVLGTLQVASHQVLAHDRVDLRPLMTVASLTARALTGLRQLEEIRRLLQSLEHQTQELFHSEATLREQTRILQSILDCVGEGVVVADANARFLVFNPAAERILGQGRIDGPQEEWSRLYGIFLPDRATPYPVQDLPLVRAIRGEASDQIELYIAYPSRDEGTWILMTGRPLRDEHGQLRGGVVVFHDISRRKRSERMLAAQYETTKVLAEAGSPSEANPEILRTICESLDWDLGAFWTVDSYTQRLRCASVWERPGNNAPRFEALTREISMERGMGLPGRVWARSESVWLSDFGQGHDLPREAAAEADGLHSAFAVPISLRGDCLGVIEFLSHQVRPADDAILVMMANLGTQIGQFIERHQMRGRVVQSEKLASLGMLSAGVAHEINNPLAYIANNLAVLDRDVGHLMTVLQMYEKAGGGLALTEPEMARRITQLAEEVDMPYLRDNMGKLLQSTRQGVKRVADIMQTLRGFARVDRGSFGETDVGEAVGTALEMVRGRLDRRAIAVEERLGGLPLVRGSAAQLNQVFLNLIINAMQAIESTGREDGRIVITGEQRNGEVVVEIADNGCGIPEEILPQIFDPFFTTKAVGDGTGLGLSVTHSMVQDHGGRMDVESALGQGTRFRVFLPAARTKLDEVAGGAR
jgi:signal transduction histidine kinase/PAS domain-containing protein